MVLHALNIDGIDHSIYMRTASKNMYNGLCSALLSNISNEDQTKITNTDINKRNIIYYTDVVNCFEGVEYLASKEMNSCICGKKHIKDNYLIRNKSTNEEYIVGSTCARNWFRKDRVKESCKYCNRIKKNGGNCKNCSAKTHLKSVLLTWKRKVVENKEMVSFGKYKGILTYKQLCDDTFNEKYVDWCINESAVDDGVKDRDILLKSAETFEVDKSYDLIIPEK
jgi:hypothetical protein